MSSICKWFEFEPGCHYILLDTQQAITLNALLLFRPFHVLRQLGEPIDYRWSDEKSQSNHTQEHSEPGEQAPWKYAQKEGL